MPRSPTGPEAEATITGTRERILDAALHGAEDLGIGKLTMEDIARRAGVARATLYTHFPNKEAILRATLLAELERFLTELETVLRAGGTAEDRLVRTFAHAYRFLRGYPLLDRLLRTEPEALLPHITQESPALAVAREWAAAQIRRLGGRELSAIDPERGGELLMRLIHSLVLSPASTYDLDGPDGPERVARDWVLPALHGTRG